MAAPQNSLPYLDFTGRIVPFPERGQHWFLPMDDPMIPLAEAPTDTRQGIWLFRAESGVCGIIPGQVRCTRAGLRIVGLAVLHHSDLIDVAGKKGKFFEIRRTTLTAGSRLIGRQCGYCCSEHQEGTLVYRCPLCGEAYCTDCWAELALQRCCSRNCRFSPGPVAEE
jgi:hypothetical protein